MTSGGGAGATADEAAQRGKMVSFAWPFSRFSKPNLSRLLSAPWKQNRKGSIPRPRRGDWHWACRRLRRRSREVIGCGRLVSFLFCFSLFYPDLTCAALPPWSQRPAFTTAFTAGAASARSSATSPRSRPAAAVGGAVTVKDIAGAVAVSYAVGTLCGHARGRCHGRGIDRQQTMLTDRWRYSASCTRRRCRWGTARGRWRQAARGVVRFGFCFTFFGPISPHELLFFPAKNKGEGEGGSAWWRWQGSDAVGMAGVASTEGARRWFRGRGRGCR